MRKKQRLQRIAIFGATSEIGGEIALRLAPGRELLLAARRMDALEQLAVRLRAAGARSVECFFFDATSTATFPSVVEAMEAGGEVDTVLAMFGVLGDQLLAESSGEEVERILHTDFTAQAVLVTQWVARMKCREHGTVVAFSSIAGARVRRPNYVYGSAKAGLDGFCQGMQDSLVGSGVRLLVVRPGFVIGRMTAGMKPAPLSSTPGHVADATVAALKKGTTQVVWIPGSLRFLAAVMPMVPRWMWRHCPR